MKRLLTLCIVLIAVVSLNINTAKADSPRMVVVEQFTATWCGPCGMFSPPFHAELGTRLDKVIPIIYHAANDIMGNHNLPMYSTRSKLYNVEGIPHAVVNGGTTWAGHPGNLQQALDAIDGVKEMSPYDLVVEWNREGNICDAKVTLNSSIDKSNLHLFVGLVEYHILNKDLDGKEAAKNGETEFHWVARKLLPSDVGQVVNVVAGEEQNFTFDFNWDPVYKDGNLYVVAFLQDMSTKEILQGATSFKMATSEITMAKNDFASKVGRATTIEKTVTVTNPNEFACDMDLTTEISNEWGVTLSEDVISLEAGAKKDVTVSIATDAAAAYAEVRVTATPTNVPEGYFDMESQVGFVLLTEDAKYATLSTTLSDVEVMEKAIQNLTDEYANNWIIGNARVIALAFPEHDFEIAYIDVKAADFRAFGLDGVLEGYVVNRMDNGKNTIVTSNIALSIYSGELSKYDYNPSKELKTLFSDDYLGLNNGQSLQMVLNQKLVFMDVIGNPDDEYFSKTPKLNINSAYKGTGIYTSYADAIKRNPKSKSKSMLKFGHYTISDKFDAGVYCEKGKSKTVFIGFPLQSSNVGTAELIANIVAWFDGTISVEDETVSDLSVYPTPVTATSTLEYNVSEFANVNIKLMNAAGSEVATLVNESLSAGNHTVTIDATNLSSGMYYAIVNINGIISTTPVVITK